MSLNFESSIRNPESFSPYSIDDDPDSVLSRNFSYNMDMETDKFARYAAVRNTINKVLCVVIKTAGDNVTVLTRNGERMTFKAQYLEPAPETEAESLKLMIEQLKREEESKKTGAVRTADPELIRSACDKFIRHIALRYPKSGEAFRVFWSEILAIAGDQPGRTWEMKPNTSSNPCPVLKVHNPATQKRVYCVNLLAGYGLRMEIKKEFLPPGCEALFPIDHAMFGAGRAVELSYRDFTPEKRKPYLDCIKTIYEKDVRPEQPA
ncbi:MAG: hypothetical protein A2X28_10705 [Elusimicrobia bacterium GWA2_56_46]|nr:MAG: hypothetical protein A2X28_10705 [Elusimicrobia bacterium GWA2_56_46]OGR55110.1 MAG: hypothetical protein A2X39_09615 [Elusimicrobia bacterium GWC2_56_31]HBW23833.1 hypothetical protein [Elusimicrobiota bacterium]